MLVCEERDYLELGPELEPKPNEQEEQMSEQAKHAKQTESEDEQSRALQQSSWKGACT